jgi:hypothetical protein
MKVILNELTNIKTEAHRVRAVGLGSKVNDALGR